MAVSSTFTDSYSAPDRFRYPAHLVFTWRKINATDPDRGTPTPDFSLSNKIYIYIV
jgi:hypothetical protein